MARVFGGDQPGRVLGVRHAARAGPEIERHRHDALHAHPHVVIEVVRPGQDHLVAGPGDAHHGEAEGLVAARGDADLARRDRRAVEGGEMRGIVLAQRGQAQDRRVAVHRRIEQPLAQVPAQLHRRRIARHRLAEIDQGPVGGEGAVQHPAPGLADRRGFDGGKPGICGGDVTHGSSSNFTSISGGMSAVHHRRAPSRDCQTEFARQSKMHCLVHPYA